MRAVRLILACVIVAAGAGAAGAQPTQPAQPTPDAAAPAPAPPTPPAPDPPLPAPRSTVYEARDDAAWKLYHEAFGELVRGRRERATELLARLQREHPGHPATALAGRAPLAIGREAARLKRKRREEATSGASAELALFQTLHGLALGIELCVALECDSAEAYVGLTLAGGLAGAVASLKAVEQLTSGQRALLNSGTAWGALNSLLALVAVEPDDEQTLALSLIAGQAAGLAAGGLLFSLRPTSGQVALANSGGQWAALLMTFALVTADPDVDGSALAVAVLAGADVGLGVGAYLAKLWPDVSRAQTLVIDAGGIVGAVGGGGLGVLISGDLDSRATSASAAVGTAVGLAAAAYFTRGWADSNDDDGPRAVVMPAEHGRGGLVGLAGAW